ncbi:MAG TPA: DsbA family protein [Solirubrobacteraceae bacterium]|nr:DsbA family protein [Solirubrobacteraceae bacterium]
MSPLSVELFTDPACPFAFSAEPVRQRLRWHYGDGLTWTVRMIVLTLEPGEAGKLAQGAPTLQRRFGMPINPVPYPREASSEPACRAVVAARLRAPDRAQPLLRCLRVRTMVGGLLDDPELIDSAVRDAGIDPRELAEWVRSAEVDAALDADIAAARDPAPPARALDHKLGGPAQERRYTAPTYLIGGLAVPGFNPIETYEVAVANADPDLPRRPPPSSVREILTWAEEPLATAEVALIMQTGIEFVRSALREVGRFEPAGADGYWTLASS